MNIQIGSWLFAILLSIGSAYYSITGLMVMFPAISVGIAVLASIVEASKLWSMHALIIRWKRIGFLFKSFYMVLILCLSILTSIGVYGHLSKGHSDQLLPQTETKLVIAQLEAEKTQLASELAILYQRQDSLNKIELGQLSGVNVSKNRNPLVAERKQLKADIEAVTQQQKAVTAKIIDASKTTARAESELNAIRYFAELVGLDSEDAIKFIIILIMIGLEPMILAHVIMASMEEEKKEEKKDVAPVDDKPLTPLVDIPPLVDIVENVKEIEKEEVEEEPKKTKPERKKRGPYKKKEKEIISEPIVELLPEPVRVGTYADIKKKISGRE
jgi:outer membrane murein-binding lipoprotein Lpp